MQRNICLEESECATLEGASLLREHRKGSGQFSAIKNFLRLPKCSLHCDIFPEPAHYRHAYTDTHTYTHTTAMWWHLMLIRAPSVKLYRHKENSVKVPPARRCEVTVLPTKTF